ncbi:molybdenum-dependent transcriptional regulator [Duffyella gerundensis]|uniref:molybdenum-dependent transcriptional regulator n=1 Tax=Duffyella TaxID=3026546 RepID=UPI003F6E22EB
MQADISLIIRLRQKLFADPRRIALLQQIQHTGSISQGAKLAGISYKSAWDAINEMNQLADHTVVERATGGKGGGGATVTAWGQRLIQLFALLEQVQQKAFDVLQDDRLPLDSLLAAISRFSLQTSARNQLFGHVMQRDHQPVQQHIAVMLNDGITVVNAAITEHSAERLQLQPGKEVLVLIKAPWIGVTTQPVEAENQLACTLTQIETGSSHSELLLTLPGGEVLCATLSNADVDREALRPGMQAIAYFAAEQVIIASLL